MMANWRFFVSFVVCFLQLAVRGEKRRVWVDLDNSAGMTLGDGVADIDDALALLQVLASPDVEIIGISPVHANAPMALCRNATKELLRRFFPDLNYDILEGAAGASTNMTPAVEGLAKALAQEQSVTLLALGALSNVATLLTHFPHLHDRIEQVIFVGGRRNQQVFHVGSYNNDSLPDLNFDRDHLAAGILLRSAVPIVLVPFEVSQKVEFGQAEVDSFRRAGGDLLLWLGDAAQTWLDFWGRLFRVEYFHPFDTLAAVALTHPDELQCDVLTATIVEGNKIKLADVVTADKHEQQSADVSDTQPFFDVSHQSISDCAMKNSICREVKYCHTPSPRVKGLIMHHLTSHGKRISPDEL